MLTEMIAVVGGENYDRVVPKFLRFQLVEDQPDLCVHERHAGMVGLRVLAPQGVVFPAQLEAESAEALDHRQARNVVPVVGWAEVELQFLLGIKVEVFLRRDERHMRLVNANRDEKRLVAEALFVEPLDGLAGIASVPVLIVVQAAWSVARLLLAAGLGEHALQFFLPLSPGFAALDRAVFCLESCSRLGDERKLIILKPVIFVPAEVARLVACRVKNLADTAGPVAVLLHELRQRHRAGARVADVDLVIQHAGRLRVQAAEKRRPRRPADRVLAIGSVEGDTCLGQAVEVRRFDMRIT